jgi:DNA repair protein RecN (Recombination protein N)
MLKRLYVRNFALIDFLETEFAPGFNIITGETGAGKSILLGALGLLTGQRAETSLPGNPEEKCVIEADFICGSLLDDFYAQNDLDKENICTIRRELLPGGKSRSFVNDTPVNLNSLKDIASLLIDIHSQHEVHALADATFRLAVLDALSGNKTAIAEYKADYKKYKILEKEYKELVADQEKIQKEQDYLQFISNEISSLHLTDGEQEHLEKEESEATHAEEIKTTLSQITDSLDGDNLSILTVLKSQTSLLQKLSRFTDKTESLSERMHSVFLELKDICSELENLSERTSYNPQRLNEVQERLSNIYRLQKKHGADSVADLLHVLRDAESRLLQADSISDAIDKTSKELTDLEEILTSKALQIRQHRHSASDVLKTHIEKSLSRLSMPDARFSSVFSENQTLSEYGLDEVRFYFTANEGTQPRELHKAASGGEMSRVMLAIKSALAGKKELPTIIFDEIDTGISGRVADKAGEVMQELSEGIQVIAITHLPQIASKGSRHFKVVKSTENGRTNSRLLVLSQEERINEIASMLSGSTLTSEAIENARALLSGSGILN